MCVEKVQCLIDVLTKRHRKKFNVKKFVGKERIRRGLVMPTPAKKGVAGKGSGLRNVMLPQLSPKKHLNDSVEIKTPESSPEKREISEARVPSESLPWRDCRVVL